jgi:hypothetical protein
MFRCAGGAFVDDGHLARSNPARWPADEFRAA